MPLSCTRNVGYIYDRGGVNRIGSALDNAVYVQWGRVRDDMSEAEIRFVAPTAECAATLAQAQEGRHELVIFRGGKRVWEGPITRIDEGPSGITVAARDVGLYLYRLIMRSAYDNSGSLATLAINRVMNILTTELARREAEDPPINVLPHVRPMYGESDARTARKTDAFQMTVFDQIDDLARTGGIDYTVLGRSLLLFDTHTLIGLTPVATEVDFGNEVRVTGYGMELATYAAVNNGQGQYATWGGPDGYYGHWEILDSAYDEEGTDIPTQSEMQSQAQRNLAGKNPVPRVLRVPENSTLNPNGVLGIDDLVPGVIIPVRVTTPLRTLSQNQKLDRVTITELPGGERVSVTMSPAPGTLQDVVPG